MDSKKSLLISSIILIFYAVLHSFSKTISIIRYLPKINDEVYFYSFIGAILILIFYLIQLFVGIMGLYCYFTYKNAELCLILGKVFIVIDIIFTLLEVIAVFKYSSYSDDTAYMYGFVVGKIIHFLIPYLYICGAKVFKEETDYYEDDYYEEDDY